jgi:Flp pilus assembly protein TadD
MPTILDALGYPVTDAEALDGVSLLDALRGRGAAPQRGQYSESLLAELGFGMAPLRAIRADGWKWIDAPRPELYDLRADPGELDDLALAEPRRGAGLARSLDHLIEQSESRAIGSQAADTDTETLEALRALGYLAAPEERAGFAGIDPKDGVRWYSVLEDARHAAQQERWQQAVDLLEPLLAEVPGNVSARNVIALAWLRLGEVERARDAYTRSLSDYPEQPRVLLALAGIELSAGQTEAARVLCERALELQPAAVEAMAHLGLIAAIDGDETQAQRWFERAIGLDPSAAHARRRFADLRFEQGRWSEAAELYAETVRVAPTDATAWLQLGAATRRLGDSERAHAAYRRAAELRPDWWVPRFNAACLWSIERQLDRAFAELAAAVQLDPRAAKAARDDADLAPLRPDPRFAALVAPGRP